MITVEASNINVGGSLVLLKDFAEYVDSLRITTRLYVAYDEVYIQLHDMGLEYVDIIKTDLMQTLKRYLQKGRNNVLYFCSLPPFRRNMNSYVYFHAEYYANPLYNGWGQLSISEKIKKIVYYFVLLLFHDNCDSFFCQTERIKKKLCETYGIQAEVKPFFKICDSLDIMQKSPKEYDFIYPALCSKHKNHLRLLEAVKLARKYHSFKLVLTISEDANDIIQIIEDINHVYPQTIINIGVVNRSVISDYYNRSKFLLFPSTMESLGLPLLEAVAHNVKVLVADRDYAFSAIENPIVFNPDRAESISSCIVNALNGNFDSIIQKAKLKDSKKYIVSCLNSNQ